MYNHMSGTVSFNAKKPKVTKFLLKESNLNHQSRHQHMLEISVIFSVAKMAAINYLIFAVIRQFFFLIKQAQKSRSIL